MMQSDEQPWTERFVERYDRLQRGLEELPTEIAAYGAQIKAYQRARRDARRRLAFARAVWSDLLDHDEDQVRALEAHRAAMKRAVEAGEGAV